MWFIALPKDYQPTPEIAEAIKEVEDQGKSVDVEVVEAASFWASCHPCSWQAYFERVIHESACIFVISPNLGRGNYQIIEKAIEAGTQVACLSSDLPLRWHSIEGIERIKADSKGESWVTYGRAILGVELEWE